MVVAIRRSLPLLAAALMPVLLRLVPSAAFKTSPFPAQGKRMPHASGPAKAPRPDGPTSTTALFSSLLSELQQVIDPQQPSPGLLLDLSAFGLLSVTGEDRLRFLHNQLTNSFADARPGRVADASYTTALGRCIDLTTVAVLEGEALVLASPNRMDQVEAAMNKYIFPMDRVTVARRPTAGVYAFVGGGEGAEGLWGEEEGGAVPGPGKCKLLRGGSLLAWGGTGLALPGFTVAAFEDAGARAVVEAARAGGVRVGGMAEWETLRIAQGRPYPDKELTPDVTPLEAGLYHTVHLEKGCYLGQETIAKVANNKGERQRLYGIQFASGTASAAIAEGARLLDKSGARAGVITSVLRGEGVGLAYVRRTVEQPVGAELAVDGGEGWERVKVVQIPYATRTEAQSAHGVKATKATAVRGEGAGADAAGAAAKEAEAERKAKKLEEMRKRLENFQAKQKGG